MKHLYSKLLVVLLLVLFFSTTIYSQNNNPIWSKIDKEKTAKVEKVLRKSEPKKAVFYQLNLNQLKARLKNAPQRGSSNKQSNVIIKFPDASGNLKAFRVMEASVMAPELQAKHQEIRSYVGQSIENPSSIIRFSVTPLGLHTMTLSSKEGTQYIDPYTKDRTNYIVYTKRDLPKINDGFYCGVTDEIDYSNRNTNDSKLINANDGMLRKFKLALACTAEYGNYHGGDVNSIKAAMTVTMTRVNGIYERDLSITMVMVENASIIYFGDVNADPYTNDNESMMLGENQTEIDTKIGEANYDIGHVFGTGGGGVAGLGVVCVWTSTPPNKQKARGATGSSSPIGDPFNVDYVAHEMGHQFGANHTFNSTTSNCGGGNRNDSTAYEPGSGSTIMAYAGICSPENVQSNSDPYFHQKSLQEIWSFVTSTGTCSIKTSTGNNAPTADAGNDYTIPILTPYMLTGSSNTPDAGDAYTYTWEEYDLSNLIDGSDPPTETTATGPLVRSFEGTSNPIRYIPRMADLRNSNGSTTWEKLVSVNRDINFQLTVRDNNPAGGQTATDNMIVTTIDAAGPFVVTSQNSDPNLVWLPGESRNITWNVAGTDSNGVDAANVDILLSTDGGFTYSFLATTGNDGDYTITVPNTPGANCRLMVKGNNNIFFDINDEKFAIGNFVTSCTQYASASNLNISIPDGDTNGVVTTLNIPDSKMIESIKVNVNITHTWISDLILTITHPNGSTLSTIWNRECGGSLEDLDVVFEDGAPSIVCGSPTNGTYAPSSPLSVFSGLDSAGDWEIKITDVVSPDTGTLNDWYIEICEAVLDIKSFEYSTDFAIYPNPNNGEFTISLKSLSNKDINVSVYDMRGRKLFSDVYRSSANFKQDINLSHLQSGMYLIKVNDGERSGSKKIVIN